MDSRIISDAMEATRRKIEGIDKVGETAESKNGWMSLFIKTFRDIAKAQAGQTYIGEEVRRAVLAAGLSHPVHPNAWGAAITMAIRQGILVETGRLRKMTTKASHARKSPEYMVASPEAWGVK